MHSLHLMTHHFHWNVKGPDFNSLHLMFMTQYTEQWNALDIIAEHIRALGHPAPGTILWAFLCGLPCGGAGSAKLPLGDGDGPSREYLWILARDKQLPADVRAMLLDSARTLGIDTQKLIWVDQRRSDNDRDN